MIIVVAVGALGPNSNNIYHICQKSKAPPPHPHQKKTSARKLLVPKAAALDLLAGLGGLGSCPSSPLSPHRERYSATTWFAWVHWATRATWITRTTSLGGTPGGVRLGRSRKRFLFRGVPKTNNFERPPPTPGESARDSPGAPQGILLSSGCSARDPLGSPRDSPEYFLPPPGALEPVRSRNDIAVHVESDR